MQPPSSVPSVTRDRAGAPPTDLSTDTEDPSLPPGLEGPAGPDFPPRFPKDRGFFRTLKSRVYADLRDARLSPFGGARMVAKALFILAWAAASYVALVFFSTEPWHALLAALSLSFAAAAAGFGIQHDANHGAFSRFPAVNRAFSWCLDLLGGSSHVWSWKHNVLHHTWTNIAGSDSDIDLGFVGRLSPVQPRRWFHRWQHWYLWFMYGALVPKWQLFDDFQNLATGRIARHQITRGGAPGILGVLFGKLVFATWAIAVPLLLHPAWLVVVFSLLVWGLLGIILSVVFQLAHCVEEAEFERPGAAGSHPVNAWAEHQVLTTVDFAQGNPLVTWFVGGLNYQVEHHLFPRICHLHYPRIAAIVRDTCREYGVRYSAHRTVWSAIGSHFRWLRRMGRPEAAGAVPA